MITTYVVGPDLTPPSITATPGAPSNGTVAVAVAATDASGVAEIKWAAGDRDIAYFATAGTVITNSFSVTENGDYTVYARDTAGNEVVSKITVSGIIAAPTGLVAVANGANGANLSWDAVSGASAYEVSRNGTVLGTVNSPAYGDTVSLATPLIAIV